jgi:hypothetical protein
VEEAEVRAEREGATELRALLLLLIELEKASTEVPETFTAREKEGYCACT